MSGGMCGRGHAWQEGVYVRGIRGRGACMAEGVCMAGGMHGRGMHVGKIVTQVDGTHATGMHSCCIMQLLLYFELLRQHLS